MLAGRSNQKPLFWRFAVKRTPDPSRSVWPRLAAAALIGVAALTLLAIGAWLLLGLAGVARADLGEHFSGAAKRIRLSPPHVARGPKLDGSLDDPVWSQAAVLDSFTNIRPVEGVHDTLGTITYVMYDDQNLYIGFRAFDDPKQVQAPVVPRDQIGQGDWVGVSIDAYNDKQRGFFLCSNPIGIQMDGVDQEGQDTDMAPDFQYTSRGRVTSQGYEVEMAVPFKTLRFIPGDHVTFGFQAIRDVKRWGMHTYWAPVTRNINSYFTQMGALEDLHGVRPGRNLQVNPEQTATVTGERVNDHMTYGDPQSRFGLGLKYGLTSNLIADVTVSPDFSQVEADAGVVDVNQQFAIFFPEKRPFFLEGSDIFTTPVNLVYTRRIVDPRYGAKLTGKVGRMSIGVLSAADRSAGDPIDGLPDAVNPYLGDDAQYSIVRLKRDIFKNSYVGLLAGQRLQDDQYNRGLGLDGRLKWAQKYTFDWQGVQSNSRDKDYTGAVAGLDSSQIAGLDPAITTQTGQIRSGQAWYGRIARDTRRLTLRAQADGTSPDFTADMGFINRRDVMHQGAAIIPHLLGKDGGWYSDIRPMLFYDRNYNYSGDRLEDDVLSFIFEVDMARASYFGTENNRRYYRIGDAQFPDIYRHAVYAGTDGWRGVRPFVTYVWGDQVVFSEAVRGHDYRVDAGANLRFSPQFDGSVEVQASTVWREQNNSRFAEQLIPRVRLSFQFTKELALRTITELRSVHMFDVNDQLTQKTQVLTPDVLFSYYVRPGTVVYLGYGSMLEGSDPQKLQPSRSSVFTKLSYLWEI